MRPSDESLVTDYMRDLEVDIRCGDRDGHHEYATKCRAELKRLQNATAITIDRYGVPSIA